MPPALSLADVTVIRDERAIVDHISVTIDHDERWVVLGANGSGKTTLLRLMAFQEHPSRGTVEVRGERLGKTDVRALRRRIGFASAALAAQLRPGLSALDVVRTARYAALEPWWHTYTADDDARAHECLTQLGVDRFARRPLGTLSSGEQQRVLLARAIMNDPAVVLLDEPSARLDLGGREDLVHTLGDLATDPASPALVLVTHHVDEIPPGITHAMCLREGRALAAGPIDEVLDAAVLSDCFGLPLHLERRTSGRFSAWARH
jgi:iron complex transport system ATP-binding protein